MLNNFRRAAAVKRTTAPKSASKSVDPNHRFDKINTKIIQEDGLLSHVCPSSSDSASISPESASCSEAEQAIAEFASQFSPQQKISFIFATRRSVANDLGSLKNAQPSSLLKKSQTDPTTAKLQETKPPTNEIQQTNRDFHFTSENANHQKRDTAAVTQTEKVLTNVRRLKTGENKLAQISHAYKRRLFLMKVMQQHSKRTIPRDLEANERIQGQFWTEVLPYCVSGYLDLASILTLRQACTRLYYGRRYAVPRLSLQTWSVITEQEIVNKVLPQLRSFLTPGSFSQLNFSRCCLLTDSFPKALVQFEQRRLCRLIKALILDFCYALSDKSLEVLLSTSLPALEVLSLRCARSRDLTGAPFSTHLSKKRWPKFHQLSCSCTQISLTHLDVVSRFLGERSIELSVPPKLGISGSLASYSLIRRLGLEKEHQDFITAIVEKGTVDAIESAAREFEKNWLRIIDDPENKKKVLYRFVRNRAKTILVNAPYSIALVENGVEHEKVKQVLESEHNTTTVVLNRPRNTTLNTPLRSEIGAVLSDSCGCCCSWRCSPVDSACQDVAGPLVPNLADNSSRALVLESGAGCGAETEANDQGANSTVEAMKTKQKSSGLTVSDDMASKSTNALDTPAACCRLMYPLPIAIRLTNLEIVKCLVNLGAYVDVWGYNFATPLYIACAACPTNFTKSQVGLSHDEGKAQASSNAIPWRNTGNEQNTYSYETFSHYDLPLVKLSSVDSYSTHSAPVNQKFRIGMSPCPLAGVHEGNPVVRNYDTEEDGDIINPLRVIRIEAAQPSLCSPTLCKEIVECNSSTANQNCSAIRAPKYHEEQFNHHNHSHNTVVGHHRESPESISDNNTQNLDVLSRSSSTSGFILKNNRNLGDGELHELGLPPSYTFRALIEESHNQTGAAELDCLTTRKIKSGGVACTCSCHQHRAEAVANCSKTCMEIIEFLMEMGAPVDAPDLYSMKCPINAAIKHNNIELLEKLIDAGARINVRSLPLHAVSSVIQYSRRHEQKKLPQRGSNRLGYKSPLFVACEFSAWKCVEVLLRRGADPHWRDPFSHRNLTPALLAYRKNADMLQLFISHGTGATKENRWVLSEILAAAILQDDLKAIEYLVREFPDLLKLESGGMWSLPLIQASRLDKIAIVQTLLAFGANPNAKNAEDLTSLHLTANEGRKSAVECLLANGALPNIIGGSRKNTPLHVAVEENRLDVVKTLLDYGADITIKDATGKTALMTAIAVRNDKAAILLLENGSVQDLDVADTAGRTALMYAIYFGQFKVADGLVNKGVTCRIVDSTGVSAESLLKAKINSFGKTTSAINKFLRNMVGGAQQVPSQSIRREFDANTVAAAVEKVQGLTMSNETVRKMNAKRKKMAKCLLKKIRANIKKTPVKVVILEQKVTATTASPSVTQEKSRVKTEAVLSQDEQQVERTATVLKQKQQQQKQQQQEDSLEQALMLEVVSKKENNEESGANISSVVRRNGTGFESVDEDSLLENSDWRILPLFCDDYYDLSSAVSSLSSEVSSESEHSKD